MASIRILAIDIGRSTGWAYFDDGAVVSGVWICSPKATKENWGKRFNRFTSYLNSLPKMDHVVYESVVRHIGTYAAHQYGGFLSHLLAWVDREGIGCDALGVGAIKKHATGKGNASKEMMMESARTKMGRLPKTDDEADALWLLDKACRDLGYEMPWGCES